jgi:hypothetical protein
MRKLLGVVLVAAAFFTACGGGNDNKSASDTTAAGAVTTAAAGASGGASFTDFCGARGGITAPNPAQASNDLKTNMDQAAAQLEKAKQYAPSEIKADVSTVAAAYKKFYDAMKSANYDFSKVNPAELQSINTPEVQAAGQRITAWADAHCK